LVVVCLGLPFIVMFMWSHHLIVRTVTAFTESIVFAFLLERRRACCTPVRIVVDRKAILRPA